MIPAGEYIGVIRYVNNGVAHVEISEGEWRHVLVNVPPQNLGPPPLHLGTKVKIKVQHIITTRVTGEIYEPRT
jgi:hypothetical protein